MRRFTATESASGSMPRIRIDPELGRSRPVRHLIVVDLPAPFGPRKPKKLPAGTARSIPSTARSDPNSRVSPRVSTARSMAGLYRSFRDLSILSHDSSSMNRLARERSPYLLQHAGNPVDWYPWGSDAFDRARLEDKPIFLSIGYSTCHWCHVMEHESFESPAIATLLNDDFVSIKVDREERPDVDRVYMSFVQSDDGLRRMAHDGVSDAGAQAVLRRDVLPAGLPVGPSRIRRPARRACPRLEERSHEGRSGGRGTLRAVEAGDRIRRARGRVRTPSQAPMRSTLPSSNRGARSTRGTAASATRRNSRGRPSCCSCCVSMRAGGRTAISLRPRFGWRWGRCARWHSAGCATTSAEGSTGIPSTRSGACRISRRCCTTRRSWRWPTSRPRRPPRTISTQRSPKTRWSTSCGICRDPEGGFYSAEDADSIPPEHAGDPAAHKMEGAFYIWADREIDGPPRQRRGDRAPPLRHRG